MKKTKIFAVVMAAVMTLSMVACGEKQTSNEVTPTTEPTTAPATPTTAPTEAPAVDPEPTTAPVVETPAVVKDASITFEDGNMGFIDVYSSHARSAKCELSLVDFNGSKAVKVVNKTGSSKCPFVAIDVSSILGAAVEDLAKVEMTVGVTNPTGNFYAVSGEIGCWYGEEATISSALSEWSVYLRNKNPKVVGATIPTSCALVPDAYNIIYLGMTTDNGTIEGGTECSELYIDDICFYDADGNLLKGDTTVAFNWPDNVGGPDYSNLYTLTDVVEFEGFQISGGAWDQQGFDMPKYFSTYFEEGAVVEIDYKSDGNVWVVMPDAARWVRVGDGYEDELGIKHKTGFINNSGNKIQIPYEFFAELCGDDVSTWGTRLQCEGSDSWEVYGVRIGMAEDRFILGNTVEFEGFQTSGGAWEQIGFDMPDEIYEALVPGSIVEIDYKCEDGYVWIVMPDAERWLRIGDGYTDELGIEHKTGFINADNNVMQIPYEYFEELCGEDKSTWGVRMQCEGSQPWEVYAVRVGSKAVLPALHDFVEFEGFQISGGAWDQQGFEMTQEIIDALVPGSVVEISYKSDGNVWVVMPDATRWLRIGDGYTDELGIEHRLATIDEENGRVYIPYEYFEELCGEDKSTWGTRMQCEGETDWEVFSIRVGQTLNK